MVWWMLATSSSPRAWMPPVPSITRSEVASAVSSMVVSSGSSPTTSVASQTVTWRSRSCPALAAAPARSVRTARVAFSGPSRYLPAWSDTRRAYSRDPATRRPTEWPLNWIIASRPRSRSTTASPRSPTSARRPVRRGRARARDDSPDSVKAEIVMTMGAMSLTFTGTVEVAEQDAGAHRALLRVKSKEAGGQGHANADVAFQLEDGGGTIHTKAQITGKAASMGGRGHRRARRADHRLHRKARRALTRMAIVRMREIREGEVPFDGGPRSRTPPTGRPSWQRPG